jgi:hypothetical protein
MDKNWYKESNTQLDQNQQLHNPLKHSVFQLSADMLIKFFFYEAEAEYEAKHIINDKHSQQVIGLNYDLKITLLKPLTSLIFLLLLASHY